jgi:hypothetical protein
MKTIGIIYGVLCFTIGDLNAQSHVKGSPGKGGRPGSASHPVSVENYTPKKKEANESVGDGLKHPLQITVESGMSAENINLSGVLFPNPVSDYLELRINNIAVETYRYELFDGEEKIIQGKDMTMPVSQIGMDCFPNGRYLLKISIENKLVKSFKLELNK